MASESKVFDDAPKGFIHVAAERLGAEIHHYIRIDSIERVEQFSQDGHFIRLVGSETVQLEFSKKEESDKALASLLAMLSPKK